MRGIFSFLKTCLYIQNIKVMKEWEKLRSYSRLKETKDTWQWKITHRPELEKKNVIKNIIWSTDKIGSMMV